MSELAFLPLAAAAELIRAKKLSPVDYTKALLAHIERHEPTYHAFIKLASIQIWLRAYEPVCWFGVIGTHLTGMVGCGVSYYKLTGRQPVLDEVRPCPSALASSCFLFLSSPR